MSRPVFLAIALFGLSSIIAAYVLHLVFRVNRYMFSDDDVGAMAGFGVVMGGCWLIGILPWCFAIRSRFRVLGKRTRFVWVPAVLWLAAIVIMVTAWFAFGQPREVPADVVTPEEFTDFMNKQHQRLDLFIYIGFGAAVALLVSALTAIGLSVPALKPTSRPVPEVFD